MVTSRDNGLVHLECSPQHLRVPSHLTQCINHVVLKSQLPHKIVDLLFTISLPCNKLTFCGGVDFLKPFNSYILSDDIEILVRVASHGHVQPTHVNAPLHGSDHSSTRPFPPMPKKCTPLPARNRATRAPSRSKQGNTLPLMPVTGQYAPLCAVTSAKMLPFRSAADLSDSAWSFLAFKQILQCKLTVHLRLDVFNDKTN